MVRFALVARLRSRTIARLTWVFLLAVVFAAAVTAAASAHDASALPLREVASQGPLAPDAAPSSARLQSGAGNSIAALALALAFGLATCARPCLLRPLLLVALLVLPFETGRHSVHHLGSAEGASQCAVAGAISQLQGTVGGSPVVLAGLGCEGVAAAPIEPLCRVVPAWPAWCGRAPPLLTAS